jgi:hypothetical protein
MIIIVKKHGGSEKRPHFKPHFNRELGKKYYSERDYHSDMEKAGLSYYDPTSIKKESSKPYTQSEWARSMLKDIAERKGRKPGERFLKELDKKGYNQKAADNARRIASGACL